MQQDNESLRTFEKKFERWKLAQFARDLPTLVPGNGEATAIRRQALAMLLVSLAAVGGVGIVFLLLAQMLVQGASSQSVAVW